VATACLHPKRNVKTQDMTLRPKLSSEAGQPTITLRTFLDGTDDRAGISESSGASEEAADPRSQTSSTLKELRQQLPSCSEGAAVYVAT
jgi:hypothetical protein